MPEPFAFRGTVTLPRRSTVEDAEADIDRLMEILNKHAPDLVPLDRRDKLPPGAEALRLKSRG